MQVSIHIDRDAKIETEVLQALPGPFVTLRIGELSIMPNGYGDENVATVDVLIAALQEARHKLTLLSAVAKEARGEVTT